MKFVTNASTVSCLDEVLLCFFVGKCVLQLEILLQNYLCLRACNIRPIHCTEHSCIASNNYLNYSCMLDGFSSDTS